MHLKCMLTMWSPVHDLSPHELENTEKTSPVDPCNQYSDYVRANMVILMVASTLHGFTDCLQKIHFLACLMAAPAQA